MLTVYVLSPETIYCHLLKKWKLGKSNVLLYFEVSSVAKNIFLHFRYINGNITNNRVDTQNIILSGVPRKELSIFGIIRFCEQQ